jgi:hypothetical protein
VGVFLKTHRIFKNGKQHIYYSLCESLRVSRKRVLQEASGFAFGGAEHHATGALAANDRSG